MQGPSTQFTVIPIEEPYKQKILEKYLNDKTYLHKASMCRFYMRGICFMKAEFCKFAHGMNDMIDYPEEELTKTIEINHFSDKSQPRTRFTNDQFFNQKPPFSIEFETYYVLYDFQQKNKCGNLSLEQINDSFEARNKLRTAMHEWNWSLFLEWIGQKYPQANLTVDWVQYHYNLKGFSKQHTHCKFGNLLTWLMKSSRYFRYDLLLPPLSELKTTIIIDIQRPRSADKLMKELGNFPKRLLWMAGSQRDEVQRAVKNQVIEAYLQNKLPNQKTSLCEYYMRGSCIFSEKDCKFCHSFQTLQYEPQAGKITKEGWFEQKRLFIDKKPNYPVLYEFQNKITDPNYTFLTRQEINGNIEIRHKLRQIVMKRLYIDFLNFLEKMYPQAIFTQTFVGRQFHNVGLPKYASNKFQIFMQQLQQFGYCEGTYVMVPFVKQRKTYLFKIPPKQVLDKYFSEQLRNAIISLIKQHPEEELPILTQTMIRKKMYECQDMFTIPLHMYLKRDGITMLAWLKREVNPKQYQEVEFDFTDILERIRQQIEKYLTKEPRQNIMNFSQIQAYVRSTCQSGSLHCLKTGLRQFIVEQLIALHNKVYFLSVNSQARVISLKKGKPKQPVHQKVKQCKCGKAFQEDATDKETAQEIQGSKQLIDKYSKQRVVVIDNNDTLRYSRLALFGLQSVGVDLEGSLRKDGYIYLVQFGFKNRLNNFENQIIVFDIFKMKKENIIYEPCRKLILSILQSSKCTKIMHDCKQDSTAIHEILNGCLKNVMDTCGMELYLQQKDLYEQRQQTYRKLLQTLQKVPGLNLVLEKYGKNGVNDLKEKMKVQFQMTSEIKQQYFEARPINEEFLEYAVRDVEDLVDIAKVLLHHDDDGIWREIGSAYSCAGVEDK